MELIFLRKRLHCEPQHNSETLTQPWKGGMHFQMCFLSSWYILSSILIWYVTWLHLLEFIWGALANICWHDWTFEFCGSEEVKVYDFISCGKYITMVVRLLEVRDAKIEGMKIVFNKRYRYFPMKVVPGDFIGASCRTGPKVCMDTRLVPMFLRDRRIITTLPTQPSTCSILWKIQMS